MEHLIGVYELTFTPADGGYSLNVVQLVAGFLALELSHAELNELVAAMRREQKAILNIGGRYDVIVGAHGDLSVYDHASGKRTLYWNYQEAAQFLALLP